MLDPDKAAIVHDEKNPPSIIHEPTGQASNQPWMQHRHSRDMRLALTYYELILNPGHVVRRGDPVTVVIGNARLTHVITQ